MNKHSSSRRNFLRSALLTTTVLGAEKSLTANETRKASSNQGTAKNVIMMVSDGMGLGSLSLAHSYRQIFEKRLSHWESLYQSRPCVRALAETYSANSIVTDSAAAASAWGSGHRIHNGALNTLPNGEKLETLSQKLKKVGKRIGLVSTATITHATPAGFAVNQSSRGDEAEIAKQYLEREIDVLLGGGQKFFDAALLSQYQAASYKVAQTRQELKNLKLEGHDKVLGVFSESHHPYSLDRSNIKELDEAVPTLSEMSEKALNLLNQSKDGFFLMIEGARIDHANHNNDATAAIKEQLEFDDAIGTVLQFIDKNPDTLLIITTDHGCGGPQMNGVNKLKTQTMSPGIYGMSTQVFHNLSKFTRSFEWLKQQKISGLSGKPLQDALKQYMGIEFTDDEIKKLQGLKFTHLNVNELIQPHTGVGWTSNNHTSELVEFCALGPGSSEFPNFIENRQVHEKLLRILGLA